MICDRQRLVDVGAEHLGQMVKQIASGQMHLVDLRDRPDFLAVVDMARAVARMLLAEIGTVVATEGRTMAEVLEFESSLLHGVQAPEFSVLQGGRT